MKAHILQGRKSEVKYQATFEVLAKLVYPTLTAH